MKRIGALKGIVYGTIFVGAVLLVDVASPQSIARAADWLFEPGAFLPRWIWGGYQEFPLPFLVLFLNWVFYCFLFSLVLAIFSRAKHASNPG